MIGIARAAAGEVFAGAAAAAAGEGFIFLPVVGK